MSLSGSKLSGDSLKIGSLTPCSLSLLRARRGRV